MHRFALVFIFIMVAFIAPAQVKQKRSAVPSEVLSSLATIGIPYGSLLVKRLPANSNNKLNQALLRNTIDTLSAALYQDFSSSMRKAIPAKRLPLHKLLTLSALTKQGLLPVADTGVVAVLKVSQQKGFAVYSMMVQQDTPCAQCEYQPRQLLNVLFTVAGNQIISALLIAYTKGDDLERHERYGYIDQHGSIYLKDIDSDELRSNLSHDERWAITTGGLFKKAK